MGNLGIIGRRKGGCRGSSKTLPFVRQNILEVFYVYTDAVKHGKRLGFRTSDRDPICWLFRHHTANIGLAVSRFAGPVPLPLLGIGQGAKLGVGLNNYFLGGATFSPKNY